MVYTFSVFVLTSMNIIISLIIQRCVVHAINEITNVTAMYTRAVLYIFQCHNLKLGDVTALIVVVF